MAEIANDVVDYADHFARLAKLITDAGIRKDLESLAAQLRDGASHSPSTKEARAPDASALP